MRRDPNQGVGFMTRLMVWISGAALVLGLATVARAQENTTGSIGGQVSDQQGGVLPGVTVTVVAGQGAQTFVTDEQGRFFAPFLTPGTYTVRAELQGFRAAEQRNVEVRLGQRAELNLKMTVGGLTETVEVTGTRAVVDTTNTTVGANIDSDMLARIPVNRTLADSMYLAPGVSSGGGTGRANPSMSGASGLENQYLVDGVNITNPGYGGLGSYSIVLGSLGTGVTFDFIQEVQVKTGGYEAQFGQATGGVVSVVTKSGTNQLRGTLFGYSQPSGLQNHFKMVDLPAANRSEAVNTTETQVSDFGAEAGGPLVRDRLFYFAAIDPQWNRTTFVAPAGSALESLGPQNRDRHILAYSTKATWQPLNGHRIDASFFGDPGNGPMGPQRRSSLLGENTAAFSRLENFGGHNQTVRYSGVLTPTWLVEGAYARSTNGITEIPNLNQYQYQTATTVTGGIGYYENNTGSNQQLQAFSTNIVNWRGQHQIRYGIQDERISYDNIVNYTGPAFTLSNGQQTVTGASVSILDDPTFGSIYRVVRSSLNNARKTRQDYLSFFAQDVWQMGSHVTVRPGVRYEQQKLIGDVTEQTFDGNWAPRLGATWDPTGTGRAKVFANYGWFFAKVPNDLAARALSADAGVTVADYFDANLQNPVADGTLAAGTTAHLSFAGLSASEFDPKVRSTYSTETLVGAEWEVAPGLSLSAHYTRRRYGRVLEDVGTLPMVAYFLRNVPGASSVEYFVTNPGTNTPVAGNLGVPISFDNPAHEYDAVTLEADRRFANGWSMQSSYRWSRLWGNFEGFFRNDNGQSDPGITSLFDFPTNDPTYVSLGAPLGFRGDIRYLGTAGNGPLPNDRRHQGKIYGNRQFAMGVNVGVAFTIESGAPLTAMAANPLYDSPGEIPETPRGEGFQTIDGLKTRTPVQYNFDLHGDYGFHIAGRRLVVLADVFNLFNTRRVQAYDYYTEVGFLQENPNFGRVLAYQTPRSIRFGARFEF
jgi:outer membrane receptor protein involved in Fe transport